MNTGTVWRKVLPAMAATLGGFLGPRIAWPSWPGPVPARPHPDVPGDGRDPGAEHGDRRSSAMAYGTLPAG